MFTVKIKKNTENGAGVDAVEHEILIPDVLEVERTNHTGEGCQTFTFHLKDHNFRYEQIIDAKSNKDIGVHMIIVENSLGVTTSVYKRELICVPVPNETV